MNPRIAGVAFSLCACFLATPMAQAATTSPFALPPSDDQPQTTTSTPATGQQPATSPFALPPTEETQTQPVTDPDSVFSQPTTSQGGTTPAPVGGVTSGGNSNTSAAGTTLGGSPPTQTTAPAPGSLPSGQSAAELLTQGTDLARQGKYEEARLVLEKAIVKEPGNVLILNNLGLVMRKLGKIEEATRAYTSAIESNPGYALTYKNYGILLEQNGEKRRAVDAYRKYCSLAPYAPDIQKVSQRADWLAGGL
jgi:hypothetical protein